MILILFNWLYIFFTAVTFGVALFKLLRIQQLDIIITTVSGLFVITLLAAIWAFFYQIALAFNSILVILAALIWLKHKAIFMSMWQKVLIQIKFYSFPFKVLLAVSSLLALAQSATLPFIIDNESYYIQTIKWLNEYGFVKGLANLHLFFGQTSGWHITQSVYSLSFLYDRFNDLNGFCLLLANYFAFQKLNSYFKDRNRLDLVFGLLPLTYAFLFQFISSPSPDFPVYIFAFILFSVYLQSELNDESFTIITILALFAFFIKITAFILLLFPVIVLVKHLKVVKESVYPMISISSLVFILFVLKNTMLTGYPLFPLLWFRINELDYTVPGIVMDFFFSKSMLNSFYILNSAYENASLLDLVKQYFLHNGLAGYIGIVSLLTFLITPIVIIKNRLPKSIWTIYFAFLLLVILLCCSSPQYRFYVYFAIFFLLLLVSTWLSNPKWILRLYTLSLSAVALLLFIPMSFGSLTANALLTQNSTFHLRNTIIPEPNSKWSSEFKGSSVGNMIYQTPVDDSFFWVTGNGKLPCVNKKQVDYFEQGFFYIPQQRSRDLNDGFYSQKVSGHE